MKTVLRALWSLWRVRVGLALALLVGAALWSNTLTDHLGYGAALVMAVFGSVLGALVGAGLPAALRRRGEVVTGPEALAGAMGCATALQGVIALVVLAHAAVGDACDVATGAAHVALVAWPGALLASAVGVALAMTVRRRGAATALAALLVPLSIGWTLVRFYRTPMVFAYDPFFGFFPGALYDERVPLEMSHVTYRLGTLGWIVAACAWVVARWEGRASPRYPAVMAGVAGLAAGVAVYLAGDALGHRHTSSSIADALGARVTSRRCVVVYDRSIDGAQAHLTAQDCDVRVAQLEAFYGVHQPRRVTVFLFANAAQKRVMMGAADTYIAKPWRDEVYLQYAAFPHPVLKHELAHVVAGQMARAPFRVSSHGVMPVPGLIEGAAVAAAWEGEGDTSPHQWSASMLAAGLAPRVRTLTSLGFFGSASSTAYTAAGSFCRWLHDRFGAAKFQRVYADGDFDAAYGMPLPALEREWHAFLRTVPVSERVVQRARARFRRASIFGRQCPLELDDQERDAVADLDAGNLARAESTLRTLLSRDPTDLGMRSELATVYARRGDVAGARRVADEAGEALGPAGRARATQRAADVVWRWQGPDAARAMYEGLDVTLSDEDEARTLGLKREAVQRGGAWSEAMRDLLVGRGEVDASPLAAVARLAVMARDGDPLAMYVVGRQLVLHERFDDALRVLDLARIDASGDARVAAEARRLVGVARFRTGDLVGARAAFAALADDAGRPMGARDAARDWVDRIDRTR